MEKEKEMSLIDRTVTVYDRHRFAVPVQGIITNISDHDGAFQVNFFPGQHGGHNVSKHNGSYFLQEQCRVTKDSENNCETCLLYIAAKELIGAK